MSEESQGLLFDIVVGWLAGSILVGLLLSSVIGEKPAVLIGTGLGIWFMRRRRAKEDAE